MLHDTQAFVQLPGEKGIWKSTPRVSLSLASPRAYPGNNPFSLQSDSGTLYLTNQRLVYLPGKPSAEFKSFSASLLNLHDTHVTVPWFGPNGWVALVQPVAGGNIPQNHHIELKLTFKDGGAPDFHTNFERIKERLQQAMEVARESNSASRSQGAGLSGINMDSVHLDELPSYENSGSDTMAPADQIRSAASINLMDTAVPSTSGQDAAQPNLRSQDQNPGGPSDAPPGYEETQQQSVQAELERRLGRGS